MASIVLYCATGTRTAYSKGACSKIVLPRKTKVCISWSLSALKPILISYGLSTNLRAIPL
jgi:methylaspartate ammonia-lyase